MEIKKCWIEYLIELNWSCGQSSQSHLPQVLTRIEELNSCQRHCNIYYTRSIIVQTVCNCNYPLTARHRFGPLCQDRLADIGPLMGRVVCRCRPADGPLYFGYQSCTTDNSSSIQPVLVIIYTHCIMAWVDAWKNTEKLVRESKTHEMPSSLSFMGNLAWRNSKNSQQKSQKDSLVPGVVTPLTDYARFHVNILRSFPTIVVVSTKKHILHKILTLKKTVPDIKLSEQPVCLVQNIK
jgi:hypothetical protein